MSHQIENMMSVGRELPWHNLGVLLPDYPKSKEELLKAAGLDWEIGELPVEVPLPNGQRLMALDKKGIVRLSDNTLLSIMGSAYTPIQPYQLVDFAYSLLDAEQGSIQFETAISMAGGRVNTLLAKIPQDIQIGGADPVELFLSFVNSHDGSLRFGVYVTPIRVVCRNTLNLSLATAQQSWSVKHSATALSSIDEARRTLNLSWKYAEEFEKSMNTLLDQEFTKRQFEQMVQKLFPKPPKETAPFSKEQYSLVGLLESSPTIDDGMRYSKYGALQAVTEFQDWNTRFNESEVSTEEKRTMHVLFGRAKAVADKTYSYLTTA